MTADHPNIDLPRETIIGLLAEHRASSDEYVASRPGGGWIIISASHVLPDGTIDQHASTDDCLGMYDHDLDRH